MHRTSVCRHWTAILASGALVANAAGGSRSTQDTIMAIDGEIALAPHAPALAELGLTLSANLSGVGNGSIIALTVVGDHPYRMLATKATFAPNLVITGSAASIHAGELTLISADPGSGHDFTLVDQNHVTLFEVNGGNFQYDLASQKLSIDQAWLRATAELAAQLKEARVAGNIIATMSLSAEMVLVDSEPFAATLPHSPPPETRAGPDVVYQNVSDISNQGTGVGGVAFSLGTGTCNIGNQNLLWLGDGTPAVGFNMYRMHDGRLMQIGLSWCKTACCAAAGSGCGLTCNGQGGNVLGSGCLDVYGSGWNAIQGNLMARSQINAWTGTMGSIPAGSGDATWRRLQMPATEITGFTSALFFGEGVYVGSDDATSGNRNNNASYRRVLFSGTSPSLTGSTIARSPAITAWRLNGLGAGVVDPRVNDGIVDVPNEGRFHTACKVTDNGNGTWTYDYAVFNLTSDRSGGSFEVPIPAGTTVTNIGFHDVNYHSGEAYDNTDWVVDPVGSTIRWHSPQTFAQNANSNALRWGTMYNFWFTANRPPAAGNATLGLFKPHTPDSVAVPCEVPSVPALPGDLDHDGDVDLSDLSLLLADFGCTSVPCAGDINGDGVTDLGDLAVLLANFGG